MVGGSETIDWSDVVNKIVASSLEDGLMSKEDFDKLQGISENAKNVTVDSIGWDAATRTLTLHTTVDGVEADVVVALTHSHPATEVVEDTTHRFVTDAEKTAWDAKETPTGAQAKADAVQDNLDTHTEDSVIHVTQDDKDTWDAKETPEGAQSKADAVQTNLTAHIGDNVKHITAAERTTWNAKETPAGAQAKADAVQTNLTAHTSDSVKHVTQTDKDNWNAKEDADNKGAAGGYAPLDSGIKIPEAYLPDSILGQVEYIGTWNASTNTPTLPTASASKGQYYVVSVAGTHLTMDFNVGDWVISNGSAWQKVDNTDAVPTVFGRTGNVVANTNDYTWAQINKATSSLADIATRPASALTQDANNRLVTDTEKGTWNAKETTAGAQAKADTAEADAKAYADDIVDAHEARTDNPHSVTKAQVGLSSVSNFPVASQAQAQAGSDAATYMTPQRTAQAITALATPAAIGAETPTGAQTKATAAENNAKAYADGIVDAHEALTNNPHAVTKAQVGLGNVTNESKATMFTNAALTGTPTTPTGTPGSGTQQIANHAFVQAAITALINGAPSSMDTLGEIAAALTAGLAKKPNYALSSWDSQVSAADNNWNSVAFGDKNFVAVGGSGTGNRVMVSRDKGKTWATKPSSADNNWISVAGGYDTSSFNSVFVAVAPLGTNRVMRSKDGGNTWANSTATSVTDAQMWSAVGYGWYNSTPTSRTYTFVAVAASGTTSNRCMTSTNGGLSWTARAMPSDSDWSCIAFKPETAMFVALAGSDILGNQIAYSSNGGQAWSTVAAPADNMWSGIAYGNGQFVAVAATGSGDRVMTSPDGINWTLRTGIPDYPWSSITYGNGMFVAVAKGLGTGNLNRIMTSPDGINWTLVQSPTDNDWTSIAHGDDTFVAVAYSGTGNRVMSASSIGAVIGSNEDSVKILRPTSSGDSGSLATIQYYLSLDLGNDENDGLSIQTAVKTAEGLRRVSGIGSEPMVVHPRLIITVQGPGTVPLLDISNLTLMNGMDLILSDYAITGLNRDVVYDKIVLKNLNGSNIRVWVNNGGATIHRVEIDNVQNLTMPRCGDFPSTGLTLIMTNSVNIEIGSMTYDPIASLTIENCTNVKIPNIDTLKAGSIKRSTVQLDGGNLSSTYASPFSIDDHSRVWMTGLSPLTAGNTVGIKVVNQSELWWAPYGGADIPSTMGVTVNDNSKLYLYDDFNDSVTGAAVMREITWRKRGSISEGYMNFQNHITSTLEGSQNQARKANAHAEGLLTRAMASASHTEGERTIAYDGVIGHAVLASSGFPQQIITIADSTAYADYDSVLWISPDFSVVRHMLVHSKPNSTQLVMMEYDATVQITVPNLNGGFILKIGASLGRSHAEGYRTLAAGDAAHGEGNGTKAIGAGAHSEGYQTNAMGTGAHSEGYQTNASDTGAHAEGRQTYARGKYSHAQGLKTGAYGHLSHAEGMGSLAGGTVAPAYQISSVNNTTKVITFTVDPSYVGFTVGKRVGLMTASGMIETNISAASGVNLTFSTTEDITGTRAMVLAEPSGTEFPTSAGGLVHAAHAEGYRTVAQGAGSHTEGVETWAYGVVGAHAEGYQTEVMGYYGHAAGQGTHAKFVQVAMGFYNTKSSSAYQSSGDSNQEILIIGNGTSDSVRGNAFKVLKTGATFADAAYASTGADLAEYFEWADGNEDAEDRVGYFVTLDGEMIRKAVSSDSYVLGIVSSTPSVIGDNHEAWKDRYVTDAWGRIQYHYVDIPGRIDQVVVGQDEEGNPVTESVVLEEARQELQPMYNPAWNPEQEYVSREHRKEWSPVGLVGKLLVRDDGTCQPNGFCSSNDDGIATTASAQGFNTYRVLKRVDDNIIQVLVK
jgi:hypothetical protein